MNEALIRDVFFPVFRMPYLMKEIYGNSAYWAFLVEMLFFFMLAIVAIINARDCYTGTEAFIHIGFVFVILLTEYVLLYNVMYQTQVFSIPAAFYLPDIFENIFLQYGLGENADVFVALITSFFVLGCASYYVCAYVNQYDILGGLVLPGFFLTLFFFLRGSIRNSIVLTILQYTAAYLIFAIPMVLIGRKRGWPLVTVFGLVIGLLALAYMLLSLPPYVKTERIYGSDYIIWATQKVLYIKIVIYILLGIGSALFLKKVYE